MSVYTILSRSDKGTAFIGTYSSFFRAERQVQYIFESQGLFLRNKIYSKNIIGYDSGNVVYEIYESVMDE